MDKPQQMVDRASKHYPLDSHKMISNYLK